MIFSRPPAAVAPISATIGQHLRTALGHEIDLFLRTRAARAAIAACQPFAPADQANPAKTVHVGFYAAAPAPAQRRSLLARSSATDEIPVEGRNYFWLCRGSPSHGSKRWTSPSMRAPGLPSSSMRHLPTIRTLAALSRREAQPFFANIAANTSG